MLAAAPWGLLFAGRCQRYLGAGGDPGVGHPVEWSQCHLSSLPPQRGGREQFYGPHSMAVLLLNFMWAMLRVLRPAVSASLCWPPASGLLGLVSHLSFSLCSLTWPSAEKRWRTSAAEAPNPNPCCLCLCWMTLRLLLEMHEKPFLWLTGSVCGHARI